MFNLHELAYTLTIFLLTLLPLQTILTTMPRCLHIGTPTHKKYYTAYITLPRLPTAGGTAPRPIRLGNSFFGPPNRTVQPTHPVNLHKNSGESR